IHPPVKPHADAVELADGLTGFVGDLVREDVCMGVNDRYLFHIKPSVSFSGQPYTPDGNDVKRTGLGAMKNKAASPSGALTRLGCGHIMSRLWGHSSAGRAPRSQRGSRGFESLCLHQNCKQKEVDCIQSSS